MIHDDKALSFPNHDSQFNSFKFENVFKDYLKFFLYYLIEITSDRLHIPQKLTHQAKSYIDYTFLYNLDDFYFEYVKLSDRHTIQNARAERLYALSFDKPAVTARVG